MKEIYKILDSLKISYKKYTHQAVFSVEESDKISKMFRGGITKNLLIRNKKGDNYYLLIVEGKKRMDLKKIAENLNETRFSFASPDRLKEILNITPGSVSVFCLIYDKEKKVNVIIDEDLINYDFVNFHPNDNTATLEISSKDLMKFIEWTGHEAKILKFI